MSFRLVPNSVTLNDLERRNCPYIAFFFTEFGSFQGALSTRNSSGDEIANVNFLYDDIAHHALQNTINCMLHKFRHRWTRLCVLERRFTKFSEITQCNGHYGHSGSFNVTDFGTNRKLIYDFLLVINTNLLPILHRFLVMAEC